uniref:COG1470 family protein n=1 Tax=Dokdonella sp. TaxID=2291710 RepID=UPI0027B9C2FC
MTPISDRAHGRAVRAPRRWLAGAACGLLAACASALLSPAFAIQPLVPGQHATQTRLLQPISAQDINVEPALEATTSLAAAAAQRAQVAGFLARYGGEWEMRWDRRNDLPNLIQGSGIALVPGRGNALTLAQLGLPANHQVDLATVETRLRDFIAANAELLGVKGVDLRLDPASSTVYGKGDSHWFVEFEQYQDGVRVDGANVFFRIAAGNIIQFGSNRIAPVRIGSFPVSARDAAFALALADIGFAAGTTVSEVLDAGELLLLPVAPAGDSGTADFAGSTGQGYAHRLVWRFTFRVHDDEATYRVLTDAHSNRVIDVQNINTYVNATVTGGIYPTTNTDPEIVVPLPFAAVTNGSAKVTDALGIYDYSGGAATSALDGKYFKMSDGCGSISLSNSTDGNLAFGSSGGTDCTTPGVGGPGNTHSSRSGFYHLTNINRKAITFLPGNTWLNGKVTANMNVNDVCNAYWNGASLNFFKSGTYGSTFCSNTGEIAAVFLHEWGHGMDTNSGGSAGDMGSGEAVGDTFAFLETKTSCIGDNFTPGKICHNCTTCTGVRDVRDFGLTGSKPIAKPSNVTAAGGIKCDDYVGQGGISCPYTTNSGQVYRGPMGYEGHCESIIASSANWDLSQMLISRWGNPQGWQEMDRIWYGSLTPSKSAYRVASGGTCNPSATVDGCGADNWYTVFLAADDDDGNLGNGTPNACRIWDAFNAHGIACGTRPVCSNDAPDFNLAITPATQSVCAMPSASASYTVNVGQQLGFTNPVALSASGLPSGVSASFSPSSVIPGNSAAMTVNVSGAAAGTATLTVSGSASGSPGHSATTQLVIATALPALPALNAPLDGATGTPRSPAFAWASDVAAESYTIEVASDNAFTTIVASGTPTSNSWTPSTPLAPLT